MSAWLLPDHIADVLPAEARHIEELRRILLDTARSYGYELVMPPLLEHLDSLLTGSGATLDLQTFKLVDQLSGRMMGLRADTTRQVARIDAHLLNRASVTRLCYCGPVLHTRPDRPHATREPLQFGAEIYGHAGPEADLEAVTLALDCLRTAGAQDLLVDLADVRIVRALLDDLELDAPTLERIHAALAGKDAPGLRAAASGLPPAAGDALLELLGLYGSADVLPKARAVLPSHPVIAEALDGLAWIAAHLDGVRIGYDLADLRGYAYYSGARFGIYAPRSSDALARGGRYDEVGAVFGRNRPAAGFSLDVKELSAVVGLPEQKPAIRAPWGEQSDLRSAIAKLRALGETVVCVLPGHEREVQEFRCDRELVFEADRWLVRSL